MRYKTVLLLLLFLGVTLFGGGSVANAQSPEVVYQDHQVWITKLLAGGHSDLDQTIGNVIPLLEQKDADPRHSWRFEILDDSQIPYTRLLINEDSSGKVIAHFREIESGKEWSIRVNERNIYSLPPGEYLLSFEIEEELPFSFVLTQVKYPFTNAIGMVSNRDSGLDEYLPFLKDGGYLLVDSESEIVAQLGIPVGLREYDESYSQYFDSGWEDIGVVLFNREKSDSNYRTLLPVGDGALAAFYPYESGGVILVSRSLLELNRELLTLVLTELNSDLYSGSFNLVSIGERLNTYRNSAMVVAFLLGALVAWALFLNYQRQLAELLELINQNSTYPLITTKVTRFIPNIFQRYSRHLSILILIALGIGGVLMGVWGLFVLRLLPGGVLNYLDSINNTLELAGVSSLLSIAILLAIIVELILLALLIPLILSGEDSDSVRPGLHRIVEKLKQIDYSKTVPLRLIKLVLLLTTGWVLLLSVKQYLGFGDSEQNFQIVAEEDGNYGFFYDSQIRYTLEPDFNSKLARLELEHNIQSKNEVYLQLSTRTNNFRALLHSPYFDKSTFPISGSNLTYWNNNSRNIDTQSQLLEALDQYRNVGLDRMALSQSLTSSLDRSEGGEFGWSDLLRTDLQEMVENAEDMHTYNLDGISGELQFFVIASENIKLELDYAIQNRDGVDDSFFVAVINENGEIEVLERFYQQKLPIGSSYEGTIKIDALLENNDGGVYQIIVGYNARSVLLDGVYSSVNRDITLNTLHVNSSKMVFRPLGGDMVVNSNISQLYVDIKEVEVALKQLLLAEKFTQRSDQVDTLLTGNGLNGIAEQLTGNEQSVQLQSFYSLYTTDRVAYFNPFKANITQIDGSNDLVIIRKLPEIENLSTMYPLNIKVYTLTGNGFFIDDHIRGKLTQLD